MLFCIYNTALFYDRILGGCSTDWTLHNNKHFRFYSTLLFDVGHCKILNISSFIARFCLWDRFLDQSNPTDEMADEESTWKRPSDVMMKRKKKLVIRQKPSLQENGSGDCKTISPKTSLKSVKRRNPFGCSATKRVALSESPNLDNRPTPSPSPNGYLFKALDAESNNRTSTPVQSADADERMKTLV